jgi:hypothetical protein
MGLGLVAWNLRREPESKGGASDTCTTRGAADRSFPLLRPGPPSTAASRARRREPARGGEGIAHTRAGVLSDAAGPVVFVPWLRPSGANPCPWVLRMPVVSREVRVAEGPADS